MTGAAKTRSGLRADIQVLRAVAVMFVVLFHLWPGLVPFGFVGVDIFFVISGFLITSHLIGAAIRDGNISLLAFWARRIRRLLPAAFVVIFVTSLGVFLWQSQSLWHGYVRQAIASTFYYENWILAADSVDYLNSHNTPTPVQQFWSLSVEEQFYIVWPVLIMLALLLVKARTRIRSVQQWAFIILGIAVVASLSWSIYLGAIGDKSGYFSTFTRAWEFGLGGLFAIAVPLFRRLRVNFARVLALAGWAMLAASMVLISPATSFPGYAALLPAAGTALVIAGGTRSARLDHDMPRWLLPVFFLGEISYSLYLWHWPAITLFPGIFGSLPSATAKLGILVFCVLVAWLSTRFVERPVQRWAPLASTAPWRTFVVAAFAAGLTLTPAMVASATLDARLTAQQNVRSASVQDTCFGAASSLDTKRCSTVTWPVLTPDPAVSREDLPTEANACKTDTLDVKHCRYGAIGAPIKVALVGDSHAGHWFPALKKLADDNGFELDIYLKSSCTFLVAQRSPLFQNCSTWSEKVIDRLSTDATYNFVVVNSLAANLADEVDKGKVARSAAIEGYLSTWTRVSEMGAKILVIRDTPHMREDTAACVASHQASPASCDVTLAESFAYPDLEAEAGADVPGVSVLDFSSVMCSSVCHPVIAGAVVFSDSHHMTATFSRSFVPVLTERLQKLGWPIH